MLRNLFDDSRENILQIHSLQRDYSVHFLLFPFERGEETFPVGGEACCCCGCLCVPVEGEEEDWDILLR